MVGELTTKFPATVIDPATKLSNVPTLPKKSLPRTSVVTFKSEVTLVVIFKNAVVIWLFEVIS